MNRVTEDLGARNGVAVTFAEDCVGDKEANAAEAMKPGTILVLENTRFHAGEENNDPAFAVALAGIGNVYITDWPLYTSPSPTNH